MRVCGCWSRNPKRATREPAGIVGRGTRPRGTALSTGPPRRTGLIRPEMALNSDKAYQTREPIDDFSSIQTGLTNEQAIEILRDALTRKVMPRSTG